jgi:hypothetical protein
MRRKSQVKHPLPRISSNPSTLHWIRPDTAASFGPGYHVTNMIRLARESGRYMYTLRIDITLGHTLPLHQILRVTFSDTLSFN